MSKIIYEAEEVAIRIKNKGYYLTCTVENKTDDVIIIVFTGEYKRLESLKLYPYDLREVLPNEKGYSICQAFISLNFYTIFEDDYYYDNY